MGYIMVMKMQVWIVIIIVSATIEYPFSILLDFVAAIIGTYSKYAKKCRISESTAFT